MGIQPWNPWLNRPGLCIRKVVTQKGQTEPGKNNTDMTPVAFMRMGF